MPGPYRECPEHGWLEINEWVVSEDGACLCPICRIELSGRYGEVWERRKPGGPTHHPRKQFKEAVSEYYEEVEG